MSIYLDLTREFNDGAFRAILSSGQAAVLHRLAVMSKDGDWILRETEAALDHVLGVLERRGARYRFGAPLDVRWMRGGWSSHLDAERRDLIHANERRLQRYVEAAKAWASGWPAIQSEIGALPLRQAHAVAVARAAGVLPFEPPEALS